MASVTLFADGPSGSGEVAALQGNDGEEWWTEVLLLFVRCFHRFFHVVSKSESA